jgi:hypothetical protein
MTNENVETSRRDHVESEIVAMLRDRRFDGLVARLCAQFPGHRQLAEDAACEAVARVLKQIESNEIPSLTSYMYKVATNYMSKVLTKQSGRETSLEGRKEVNPEFDVEAELGAERTPGALDERIGADLVRNLKSVTATWNDNIRVITNLVLEHAFADDYDWMTAEDLAQEASAILGEEMSSQTATMWKSRGLKRIREHFNFD